MRISIVTKEWPPEIYGGAGVHVEHLVQELRKLAEVDVHAFGEPKLGAKTYPIPAELESANGAIQSLGVNLSMLTDFANSNVVHSHTWYANMAGHLGSLLHGIPHIVTAHSLEPLRPWKAEQLGGGYQISSWIERTAFLAANAVIAVSHGMKRDLLCAYPDLDPGKIHVVHNGIDTKSMKKVDTTNALTKYGIELDRPYVLFVGRITRQKGIMHLLRAAEKLPAEIGLVLCASSPDTKELGNEVATQIEKLAKLRTGIHWITEQVSRPELVELLSNATAFSCPSIYEPLGIVNLEAMACEVPVVASNVGGIPEVVVDGETGLLVNYDEKDPESYEIEFAQKLTQVVNDKQASSRMGSAGRKRAELEFGWDKIATQTLAIYDSAIKKFRK